MDQISSRYVSGFKLIGLTLVATAALLACGGGGSSNPTDAAGTGSTGTGSTGTGTGTGTTSSTVELGVSNTLAALGNPPAVTSANATSTAFDLVATIGDTWKINFDTNGNAYTVTVLQTQFGLSNSSAGTSGTFTSTTSGNYTTYKLSGSVGELVVDNRTKAIAGNLTIGSKSSTVAGTGYAAPALDKSAGTYNFVTATRDVIGGGSPDLTAGQFLISANGTSVALCPGGTINAAGTACTPVVTGYPTTPSLGTVTSTNGVIKVALTETGTSGTTTSYTEFRVQVGDHGPVLLGDSYGISAYGGALRTGTVYAVKAVSATGTEFNGSWACLLPNVGVGTNAVVNGATATVTDVGASPTTQNIYYNKIATGLAIPGFLSVGSTLADSVTVLVLSSSLVVAQSGDNYMKLAVCRRQD